MMSKNDRVRTEPSATASRATENVTFSRSARTTWRLAIALTLVACGLAPFTGCAAAPEEEGESKATAQALLGDGLVISQVYGAGGNAGTPTYNQDFVEIFNRSNVAVSTDGLSLQYGSSTGNIGGATTDAGVTANVFVFPNVAIAPGEYFLVATGTATATGPALPPADALGPTLTLAGTSGKVALARTTASLACGATGTSPVPCDGSKIVDLVGFGTAAKYFEGTGPTPDLSVVKAAIRNGSGCIDTNSNAADFVAATPSARNSTSPLTVCGTDPGSPDAQADASPLPDAGPDADDSGVGPIDDAGFDAGEDTGPALDAGTSNDAGSNDASAPVDAGPSIPGTGLVISQLYGAGGNANAPLNRDYVELFNRSSVPISLAGLSLQYGSATGNFAPPLADGGANPNNFALPNDTVLPGQYYLVAMTAGTVGSPVESDATGALSMGAAAGKVALARTTNALNCGSTASPCSATDIVDLLGYGAGSFFEGSAPAAALSASTAAFRKGQGCIDTNDNAADFTTGGPVPRNRATPVASCSATPPDGGPPTSSGGPLVLSGVYGGGGNANATYNRDYVEIFNRSNAPVSIAGFSIQYGGGTLNFGDIAGDAGPEATLFALPNATIQPGKYFLVGLAFGTNTTAPAVPTVDADGAVSLGAVNGKIALARTTSPLGCGGASRCGNNPNIVDMVGYGTGSDYEGSGRTPAISATLAAYRKGQGCVDTDDNTADFTTGPAGAPAPRNSTLAAINCATVPTDAGTPDSGTGSQDGGSRPTFDSGPPPRNDSSGGNGIDSDSGCNCRTSGTGSPADKRLAFGMLGALGLVITARRRRVNAQCPRSDAD